MSNLTLSVNVSKLWVNFLGNVAHAGFFMCNVLLCCVISIIFKKGQKQKFKSVPQSIPLSTAPCPPNGVKELVNCNNGTVTITWSTVSGALTYTATLEDVYGDSTTCCTTSNTSCDVTHLPCGEIYIVRVTVEGRTCNSSESEQLMFRTGTVHTVNYIKYSLT